jgi:hypothetical protein
VATTAFVTTAISTQATTDSGTYAALPTAGNTSFGATSIPAGSAAQCCAAFGDETMQQVTTGGDYNTAVGTGALKFTLAGAQNVGVGFHALEMCESGNSNVSVGYQALVRLQSGDNNLAVGRQSLSYANGAWRNVAIGQQAMLSATTAIECVVIGDQAGYAFLDGVGLTVVGRQALMDATGSGMTAIGYQAGRQPGGDSGNTTTTAVQQTLIGYQAGQSSTTQQNSVVAIGYRALVGGAHATAIGCDARALAAGAIAIGRDSTGQFSSTSVQDEAVIGTGLTSLKVGDPGGGQGAWMLGKYLAASVTLDTAHYVDVKIDGVQYRLAVVS